MMEYEKLDDQRSFFTAPTAGQLYLKFLCCTFSHRCYLLFSGILQYLRLCGQCEESLAATACGLSPFEVLWAMWPLSVEKSVPNCCVVVCT